MISLKWIWISRIRFVIVKFVSETFDSTFFHEYAVESRLNGALQSILKFGQLAIRSDTELIG